MKVGMVVSPFTGQKVLAIQQTSENQKFFRDKGKGKIESQLNGNVGDRYNYITLQNYGKGEMYPVPNKNIKTMNNGKRSAT